ASGKETRVAPIEQGTISEYYLDRKNEKGIVGNIYKGKVVRVLPGMQAAFVDIGLDKAAFLYVGDIVSDPTFPGFSEEMDIKAGSVEGDPLAAAGLQTAEPAKIVDLHPDEAIETEEDGKDNDEEELDEADAPHATADEALAAKQAQTAESSGATPDPPAVAPQGQAQAPAPQA